LKLSTRLWFGSLFVGSFVEALIAMLVWNGPITEIFNVPHIGYWQMWLILWFVGTLFPMVAVAFLGAILNELRGEGDE